MANVAQFVAPAFQRRLCQRVLLGGRAFAPIVVLLSVTVGRRVADQSNERRRGIGEARSVESTPESNTESRRVPRPTGESRHMAAKLREPVWRLGAQPSASWESPVFDNSPEADISEHRPGTSKRGGGKARCATAEEGGGRAQGKMEPDVTRGSRPSSRECACGPVAVKLRRKAEPRKTGRREEAQKEGSNARRRGRLHRLCPCEANSSGDIAQRQEDADNP